MQSLLLGKFSSTVRGYPVRGGQAPIGLLAAVQPPVADIVHKRKELARPPARRDFSGKPVFQSNIYSNPAGGLVGGGGAMTAPEASGHARARAPFESVRRSVPPVVGVRRREHGASDRRRGFRGPGSMPPTPAHWTRTLVSALNGPAECIRDPVTRNDSEARQRHRDRAKESAPGWAVCSARWTIGLQRMAHHKRVHNKALNSTATDAPSRRSAMSTTGSRTGIRRKAWRSRRGGGIGRRMVLQLLAQDVYSI